MHRKRQCCSVLCAQPKPFHADQHPLPSVHVDVVMRIGKVTLQNKRLARTCTVRHAIGSLPSRAAGEVDPVGPVTHETTGRVAAVEGHGMFDHVSRETSARSPDFSAYGRKEHRKVGVVGTGLRQRQRRRGSCCCAFLGRDALPGEHVLLSTCATPPAILCLHWLRCCLVLSCSCGHRGVCRVWEGGNAAP